MFELASPWQMSQYLDSKGYDIFPFKIDNGMYKVSLWRFDSFVDFGKFEYSTWQESVSETTKAIYGKLINKPN